MLHDVQAVVLLLFIILVILRTQGIRKHAVFVMVLSALKQEAQLLCRFQNHGPRKCWRASFQRRV